MEIDSAAERIEDDRSTDAETSTVEFNIVVTSSDFTLELLASKLSYSPFLGQIFA